LVVVTQTPQPNTNANPVMELAISSTPAGVFGTNINTAPMIGRSVITVPGKFTLCFSRSRRIQNMHKSDRKAPISLLTSSIVKAIYILLLIEELQISFKRICLAVFTDNGLYNSKFKNQEDFTK